MISPSETLFCQGAFARDWASTERPIRGEIALAGLHWHFASGFWSYQWPKATGNQAKQNRNATKAPCPLRKYSTSPVGLPATSHFSFIFRLGRVAGNYDMKHSPGPEGGFLTTRSMAVPGKGPGFLHIGGAKPPLGGYTTPRPLLSFSLFTRKKEQKRKEKKGASWRCITTAPYPPPFHIPLPTDSYTAHLVRFLYLPVLDQVVEDTNAWNPREAQVEKNSGALGDS